MLSRTMERAFVCDESRNCSQEVQIGVLYLRLQMAAENFNVNLCTFYINRRKIKKCVWRAGDCWTEKVLVLYKRKRYIEISNHFKM